MFNGTKETVSVQTPSQESEIYVNGQYVGEGQAQTSIRKKGNVTITAKREGCRSHSVQVDRTFDPVTLLGLFIDGGLFSILLIDGAATGAWSKAVRTSFSLSPRCEESGEEE